MTKPLAESQPVGLYADAGIYDILHAPGTASEVRGLTAIERRFASGRLGRWLEPACGTGRYLRAAAKLGHRVSGFDRDAAMIAYARSKTPRADLRVAGMERFMIARWRGCFSLLFNPINTIRHLPSDASMLAHFEQVESALQPGGVYVIGLSLAHYGHEGPSEDVWTARRGAVHVTQIVQFEPGSKADRDERVYSHLMIERPGRTEHRDSAYTLRSYNLAQWKRLIGRSPLRILASVDEQGQEITAADGCYRLFVLGKRGS